MASCSGQSFHADSACLLEGQEMTAIAMIYTGRSFLIGADGRCKADEGSSSKERETDQAQKIFLIQNKNVHLAYSITGFASTDDGSFQIVVEAQKQADKIQTERFSNGDDYVRRFCLNLERSTTAAMRDGRIKDFPKNEHLGLEDKARKFRLFFVGYFKGLPLWMEVGFYHEGDKDRIRVRVKHFSLDQIGGINIGSTIVAKMMYDQEAVVDPRLAKYKKGGNDGLSDYFLSYLKACCDPVACEIDPQCKFIGGHIHAAEIAADGIRWLIEPLASTSGTD
jgi:hypothetical protein